MTDREALGRRVREIWVEWASEQPDPKPSWLEGWDELGDGQREADMRIGEGIAAAERERLRSAVTAMRDQADDLSASPAAGIEVSEDSAAESGAYDAVLELLAAAGSE